MSSSQMNYSISTSSDIEVRYHKAIKEISKLININTNLKKQSDYFKNICNEQQNQINRIIFDCQNLKRDNNYLVQQTRALESQRFPRKSSPQKINPHLVELQNKVNDLQKKLKEADEERDCDRIQIQSLKQKLNSQGQTISQLEDNLGTRNQENKILQEEVQQLKEQISNIELEKQKIRSEIELKEKQKSLNIYPSQCINCHRMREQLNLVKEWSHKIDEQNISLKKKTLLETNTTNLHHNLRGTSTSKFDSSFSFMEALQMNAREASTIKKEQNLKLKRNLMHRDQQIQKLKHENNRIRSRMVALQKFLQKEKVYFQKQFASLETKGENLGNQK